MVWRILPTSIFLELNHQHFLVSVLAWWKSQEILVVLVTRPPLCNETGLTWSTVYKNNDLKRGAKQSDGSSNCVRKKEWLDSSFKWPKIVIIVYGQSLTAKRKRLLRYQGLMCFFFFFLPHSSRLQRSKYSIIWRKNQN